MSEFKRTMMSGVFKKKNSFYRENTYLERNVRKNNEA